MRKLGKYKEMIRSPQFRALTTIFKGAEKGHNALALRRQIERTIRIGGPLTIAEVMRQVNSHPEHGYYSSRSSSEIFGHRGDFVTAPELSQVFGEMFALYFMQEITGKLSNARRGIRLIELGPGSGSLTNSILHTIFQFPTIAERVQSVILLECSSELRKQQERLLIRDQFRGISFQWHTVPEEISIDPDTLSIIYCNEFFDALPIHAFKCSEDGVWKELLVDAIDTGDDVAFRMVQSSGETIASRLVMKNGLGQVDREITKRHKFLEISPEISRLSHLIANLILPGGIFLTADYGSMDPFRDSISLRAIRRHQILDDPISNIGNADFSADVDFSAIMRQFPIDRFHQRGLVSQGSFLKTMGIMERARMLESVDPLLMKTIERLISPDKMGQIYKVFAATSR